MALKEEPSNFLLMHTMTPNVAGVMGEAIAAAVAPLLAPSPTIE